MEIREDESVPVGKAWVDLDFGTVVCNPADAAAIRAGIAFEQEAQEAVRRALEAERDVEA